MFVAVEAAATSRFRAFAAQLAAKQGELDRIVVDEARLTVTASDYRPAMVDLALIRSVRTQFVYLTTTSRRACKTISNCRTTSSGRGWSGHRRTARTCSTVERNNTRKPLLQDAADRARDAWHRSGLFDQARDKIILYTLRRRAAAALSALLGCAEYTSGAAATADEKQQILKAWLAAPEQPYINHRRLH